MLIKFFTQVDNQICLFLFLLYIGDAFEVIQLGNGDSKTDAKFPLGANCVLEVKFQNQQGHQLRVTENQNPAAAPRGFVALEPVSHIVELGGGTIDISTGQVAHFCAKTNSFVFGEGEPEFEADENELTLTVRNMVGDEGATCKALLDALQRLIGGQGAAAGGAVAKAAGVGLC
ncbi:hypothetical protein VTI74DRAFT_1538 [Chaetomium olivicolor]